MNKHQRLETIKSKLKIEARVNEHKYEANTSYADLCSIASTACNMHDQGKYDRMIWIDIMRGLGILLVVLGHTRPPFTKFIYGFHMPLFFLLSGYLLTEKKMHMNFMEYLKLLARSYLIPYFVMCGINLILQLGMLLINHQLHKDIVVKYIVGILYSRGTVEWMPNCSLLWFLTALFVSLIFFYCIEKLGRYSLAGVAIACLISYALDVGKMVKLPWNMDSALMVLAFIFLGYKIKTKQWIEHFDGGKKYLLAIVFFAVGCLAIVLNPIDSVNFDSNHYGNLLLMFTGAFGVNLSLFIIFPAIQKNNMFNKFIAYLGRHTLFIMGFDYFSGVIAGIILGKMDLQHWAIVFVFKMMILMIGLQVWYFIVSRLPWKLGLKLKY